MKRFHVHLAVGNLTESIAFYSKLFGATPTVEKPDYAKWMLDDPRVNFAISQRGQNPGLNHLGFQVESEDELTDLREQVRSADIAALDEAGAACCYARSEKYWVQDPQGIAWETFQTLGDIPVFGAAELAGDASESSCCTPEHLAPAPASGCCPEKPAKSSCCG